MVIRSDANQKLVEDNVELGSSWEMWLYVKGCFVMGKKKFKIVQVKIIFFKITIYCGALNKDAVIK